MDDDGSYEITVDHEGRRIHATLSGMLDEAQAEAAREEVLAAAEELGEPFQLINDISEFRPVSQDVTDVLERVKAEIANSGVTAVARVLGDSVTGKLQFERVGDGDDAYHVTTAESVERAEELLEEFRARDGE